MFIERLTKSDLQEFVGDDYEVLGDVCISGYYEPEIRVSIRWKFTGQDNLYVFLDFSSRGLSQPKNWIKYLGYKFGEEYKQAYLAHCMTVFDGSKSWGCEFL